MTTGSCKHGVWLYGTHCATCDREASTVTIGGRTIPIRSLEMKVGDTRYTVDIEELLSEDQIAVAARMRDDMKHQRDQAAADVFVHGRWRHTMDTRPRPDHINPSGHRYDKLSLRCLDCGVAMMASADGRSPQCGIEIINDPTDNRGLDARTVGASA